MDTVKLPPRLALLASLVPPGAALADVGSDHGLLPIYLITTGWISSAVATDINAGPISRARANAETFGVSTLRCVQCDGLAAVSPEEADTIVIAGMGGETIAGILRAAPWTREDKLLLLSPMSRPEALRRALSELGYLIEAEHLVKDAGRIYSVIQARGGTPKRLSEAEEYLGAYELISGETLFGKYLARWEERLSRALEGLSRSSSDRDTERRAHLNRVLQQIKEMKICHADSR